MAWPDRCALVGAGPGASVPRASSRPHTRTQGSPSSSRSGTVPGSSPGNPGGTTEDHHGRLGALPGRPDTGPLRPALFSGLLSSDQGPPEVAPSPDYHLAACLLWFSSSFSFFCVFVCLFLSEGNSSNNDADQHCDFRTGSEEITVNRVCLPKETLRAINQ